MGGQHPKRVEPGRCCTERSLELTNVCIGSLASILTCQRHVRLDRNLGHGWQCAAMQALLLVAERGGPVLFARIGVMRALNAGKPGPEITPRRKRAKAYRIVL